MSSDLRAILLTILFILMLAGGTFLILRLA